MLNMFMYIVASKNV